MQNFHTFTATFPATGQSNIRNRTRGGGKSLILINCIMNANAIVNIIETLVPICVMCVLPIMVVWLITRARVKKNDQKMAVLVKAIENGVEIDPELLISETESSRNTKMKLIRKLTTGIVCFIIGVALLICPSLDTFEDVAGLQMLYIGGGVFIAVGIAFAVVFFVGKKYLAPEIEAEEKKLQK